MDAPARLRQVLMDPAVLQRLPEPVRLASGHMSTEFVDAKLAVDDPDDLELAGEAMAAAARRAGATFDAVGGIVLGAVPFTFAVARAARCRWFLIRKEPKGRGTNLWVEGTRLDAGDRVMVVEDVVTTGGSILQAVSRVRDAGASVVFACALVDRGDQAGPALARLGVPYEALLTYRDLDIEAVGGPPGPETAGPGS